MSDWVAVDVSALKRAEPVTVRGIKVDVRLSPYDVPTDVRGYYDRGIQRFVIELRYIGNEPLKEVVVDKFVTSQVGRNSGRPYVLKIDVKGLGAKAVGLEFKVMKAVSNALTSLRSRSVETDLRFDIADKAIENSRDELMRDLAEVV